MNSWTYVANTQHGRQLGSEKILKKDENQNKSAHFDNCSYVKGEVREGTRKQRARVN